MPNFDSWTSLAAAPLACAAIACVACGVILYILLKTGLAWRLATDIPNDRSLHTLPVPRVGGWGIVPVVAVLMWLRAGELWLVALLAVLLAALSQIDDRKGLPARVRFGGHVAAVAVLIVVYPASVAWWLLCGAAFLLVWLINLYNFMDGADGLAGGMALFGFGGYAIAAATRGQVDTALVVACGSIAGAAAGFLVFNLHPAKIFLGDAGSIPLGFLAGALGYWGWREGVWPVWFPVVAFSPFISDASVTLLKRLLRGEKFWQAHREHYYQRLVRSGLGHAATARIWYSLMLAGIIVALIALGMAEMYQWVAVAAWALVLVLVGLRIDHRWRQHLARSE